MPSESASATSFVVGLITSLSRLDEIDGNRDVLLEQGCQLLTRGRAVDLPDCVADVLLGFHQAINVDARTSACFIILLDGRSQFCA